MIVKYHGKYVLHLDQPSFFHHCKEIFYQFVGKNFLKFLSFKHFFLASLAAAP